jgi:hypothetical protein
MYIVFFLQWMSKSPKQLSILLKRALLQSYSRVSSVISMLYCYHVLVCTLWTRYQVIFICILVQ